MPHNIPRDRSLFAQILQFGAGFAITVYMVAIPALLISRYFPDEVPAPCCHCQTPPIAAAQQPQPANPAPSPAAQQPPAILAADVGQLTVLAPPKSEPAAKPATWPRQKFQFHDAPSGGVKGFCKSCRNGVCR